MDRNEFCQWVFSLYRVWVQPEDCQWVFEGVHHIIAPRRGGAYYHHGVHVGNGLVIHYGRTSPKHPQAEKGNKYVCSCRDAQGNPFSFRDPESGQYLATTTDQTSGVRLTCLYHFAGGEEVSRFKYDDWSLNMMLKVGGTCSTRKCDDDALILSRAVAFLREGSFGKYDLVSNNCETFAFYCMTGIRLKRSYQVMRGSTQAGLGGAGWLHRHSLYLIYAKTLGPFCAIPILVHETSLRVRTLLHDKRLNVITRAKRIPVNKMLEKIRRDNNPSYLRSAKNYAKKKIKFGYHAVF